MRVHAFASVINRCRKAPSVLRALADALLFELRPLHAVLLQVDGDACRAQVATAQGIVDRSLDSQTPSLVSLVECLRGAPISTSGAHGTKGSASGAHGTELGGVWMVSQGRGPCLPPWSAKVGVIDFPSLL